MIRKVEIDQIGSMLHKTPSLIILGSLNTIITKPSIKVNNDYKDMKVPYWIKFTLVNENLGLEHPE